MERLPNALSPNGPPNGQAGQTARAAKVLTDQGDGCIAQLVEQLTLNQPLSKQNQHHSSQICYNSPIEMLGVSGDFPNG